MLASFIEFLECSPQIRSCVQKLTLRRRSPINGALLPHTQSQLVALLSPTNLPNLRHLSLINVLFIRPFTNPPFEAQTQDSSLIPPLDSLNIHLDHGRHIHAIDILYLLSVFHSVRHLTFTGCPTITVPAELGTDGQSILSYRYIMPKVLTFPRLSSYVPLLLACSPTIMKNLSVFKAGLFDIPTLEEADTASLHQVLKDIEYTCNEIALYYTILDRHDRCRSSPTGMTTSLTQSRLRPNSKLLVLHPLRAHVHTSVLSIRRRKRAREFIDLGPRSQGSFHAGSSCFLFRISILSAHCRAKDIRARATD